ncbi:MAG: S24 family peptidase, partial [Campylobacterota bacterium]
INSNIKYYTMETIKLEYIDVFDNNKSKHLEVCSSLIKESYNLNSLFALMVDGESMQPLINHKSVIVADLSNKKLVENGVYIVYYENKMWIKKYKNKKFISINPNFNHLIYKQEEVHIVAKAVLIKS